MFRISALALCLAAAPVWAQSAGDSLRRPFDPGDPAIKGPALEYRSVFASEPKRPSGDTAWPQANDEVARLKGHAGHIRDAAPAPGAAETRPSADRAGQPHHRH